MSKASLSPIILDVLPNLFYIIQKWTLCSFWHASTINDTANMEIKKKVRCREIYEEINIFHLDDYYFNFHNFNQLIHIIVILYIYLFILAFNFLTYIVTFPFSTHSV